MKSYTKKMLSLTSSLLIAAQQCFVAMPAGAVDAPSEAEDYAQSIGLELNSDAAEDALSDLIDLNDSDLAVSVDDNNKVTKIDGLLSEDTVNDSNDAKDIIAKTSELLGIDNVNREIRLSDVTESEYNRVYVFKQYYQGLEMVNSYVKVVVDKETGEAEYLNSSVIPDFSIDTTPSITAQQAIDAVAAAIGQNNASSHTLAVYSEDNKNFTLAWAIGGAFIGEQVYYVDANTGKVLNNKVNGDTADNGHTVYYNTILLDWNNKILPASAYCFNIDIATESGKYKFHDMKRNLYVINNPSWYAWWEGRYLHTNVVSNTSYTVKSTDSSFSSHDDQYAVACLYNVERVYDFFKNNFNFSGYNGKNGTMYIVPTLKEANKNGSNKHGWANACSGGNTLSFGEGDGSSTTSFASDLDTIAHEFAHSLTGAKVGWGASYGEAGSLNEAYSDIFGEFCDTTREWQIGTDMYLNNTGKNTSKKKTYYLRDLTKEDFNLYTASYYNDIEPHAGSRLISHVAYLMHYYGVADSDAMRIWYTSLDYLTSTASFADCRDAVVKAANKVLSGTKRDAALTKIKTAFNRVRVCKNTEVMGDIDGDKRLTSFDLTMLKQIINGSTSYNATQKAQADINCDGKINAEDARQLQDYLLAKITKFTNKAL